MKCATKVVRPLLGGRKHGPSPTSNFFVPP